MGIYVLVILCRFRVNFVWNKINDWILRILCGYLIIVGSSVDQRLAIVLI